MTMERLGQGTLLAVSADGGGSWTNIARIETIGEFTLGEVEDVESTSHDTVGMAKTYMAGLADAGEVEFSGIWIADASQRSLPGLRGLVRDWRITLPGGLGVWRGVGYLRVLSINPEREALISFSCTLRISGQPTMTW